MSELIFSTVAKLIKSAMSDAPNDPDLVATLYSLVAKPLRLCNRQCDSIHIEKKYASLVMNSEAKGEIRKDIQNHAYDKEVTDNIEKLTQKEVLEFISDVNKAKLRDDLISLIENDDQIPQSKRKELLGYAASDSMARFVGYTVLYTFTVPNVPESTVMTNSIQKRITMFLNGQKRKAQKPTCEKFAKWLSGSEARKWLLGRVTVIEAQNAQLLDECRSLYENEKEQMPQELVSKIEQKLGADENIEAITLLILWSIFRDNIQMLSFLYSDEFKTRQTTAEPPTETRLLPHIISANPIYIGHEKLIDSIHDKLQNGDHFVFLQGMGGIGKTETAKRYARKYSGEYDTIVFAEFNSSVIDLLNDNTVFTLTRPFVSDRFLNKEGVPETDEEFYQRKLTALRCVLNKRTLIILDNVDVQDPSLPDFLTGLCHVIVTTRWDSSTVYSEETIPLEDITDLEECKQIFSRYYKKDVTSDPFAEKIIEHFSGHILAIELTAKQMLVSDLSPEEMWNTLSEHGEEELEEEFHIPNKSRKAMNMTKHIRQIFDMTDMNEMELYILSCMSLMPKSGLEKKYVRSFCGLKSYSAINALVSRSWLRELDGVITMHTLINETVQIVCHPDLKSCLKFVELMIDEFSSLRCYNAEVAEKHTINNIAEHIKNAYPEPEMETSNFYEWTELIFSHCDKPKNALDLSKKLYTLYKHHLGDKHFKTARMLCRIGCNERSCNHLLKAVELLNQGRSIIEQISNKNNQELMYLSDVDEILQSLYLNMYDQNEDDSLLIQAERFASELIEIRNYLQSINISEYKTPFTGYLALSRISTRRKEFQKSKQYILNAENIYHKFRVQISLYNLNYTKAELSTAMGKYDIAIEQLEKAFIYREPYFGNGLSGDSATNYIAKKNQLAQLYEKTGNIEMALKVYRDLYDSTSSSPYFSNECARIIRCIDSLTNKYCH